MATKSSSITLEQIVRLGTALAILACCAYAFIVPTALYVGMLTASLLTIVAFWAWFTTLGAVEEEVVILLVAVPMANFIAGLAILAILDGAPMVGLFSVPVALAMLASLVKGPFAIGVPEPHHGGGGHHATLEA